MIHVVTTRLFGRHVTYRANGGIQFRESRLSGQPVISLPESGALGSVLGNTLELSNVDLAEEFVQLIKAQQAFTASARVISTTDELLTETVNLTR